jgi:hypothetical protein
MKQQNGRQGRRSARRAVLAREDRQYLKQLESKLQMVRDRVAAVDEGYATGLYLHGEGGTSKSFTVLRELDHRRADYVLFNSRMTGRGLYNSLERFPSSIHVLEDMEALTRDRGAQGVLRSALWAQRKPEQKGPLERLVTWTTYKMEHSFIFTGGIIMIANRSLDDVPELRAVKSRIVCMHLEVTAHELRALMRHVAGKGYSHKGIRLAPGACQEVCEYLIEQSLSLRRSLDMRLLINSFNDRLQWEAQDATCHWKDLVTARTRERPTALLDGKNVVSRMGRKQREHEIVAEILATSKDKAEQTRLWAERTGKSQAAWYRRRAEVGSNGSHSRKSEKVQK